MHLPSACHQNNRGDKYYLVTCDNAQVSTGVRFCTDFCKAYQ